MREARDSELRLGCACDDEMVALLTLTANGDSFSRPGWRCRALAGSSSSSRQLSALTREEARAHADMIVHRWLLSHQERRAGAPWPAWVARQLFPSICNGSKCAVQYWLSNFGHHVLLGKGILFPLEPSKSSHAPSLAVPAVHSHVLHVLGAYQLLACVL